MSIFMLPGGNTEADRKLKNMFYFDVNNGIARRAWARNENALTAVQREITGNPSIEITLPYSVDEKVLKII